MPGTNRFHPLRALHARYLLATTLVFLFPFSLFAQNPSSDTTSTGQILTVTITAPPDSSAFPGPAPCVTDVTGLVTLTGTTASAVNILYVIDVSGSTTDPTFHPPIDVNGDGSVNAGDDLNRDGVNGDILDAEISGVLALNASIHPVAGVQVGLIAYASRGAAADVSPSSGLQRFIAPDADVNANGIPDLDEVVTSLDSEILGGGSIDLFQPISQDSLGNSTNFEAALRIILSSFANSAQGESNIVFFLSDGRNEIGGPLASLIAEAAQRDIIINTIGITSNSNPNDLQAIATGTGGLFQQVEDPSTLRTVLPQIPVVGISEVSVNGQVVDLSAAGTFATTVELQPGPSNIVAQAVAEDQTTVAASVGVTCSEPLSCQVEITSPLESALLCEESVQVTGNISLFGGQAASISSCEVNGVLATISDNQFSATIPCPEDSNKIVAVCVVVDATGAVSICQDSVTVVCSANTRCALEITSPADSAVVALDRVRVVGSLNVEGGPDPIFAACLVNGVQVPVTGGGFVATVPCDPGENTIVATCIFIDLCGRQVTCSDTIRVFCDFDTLTCEVDITSPRENAIVCGDSVTVNLAPKVTPSVLPPTVMVCDINGVEVRSPPLASQISARIPVVEGENEVIARCVIFDIAGNQSFCADSVRFTVDSQPQAIVEITSPPEGAVVCADSLNITTQISASGAPPLQLNLDVNGTLVPFAPEVVTTKIGLSSGENLILVSATVIDSCGNEGVAIDSVTVFLDDLPPTCTFFPSGIAIAGSFFDAHSGIAEVVPKRLRNTNLIVDPFTPGDKLVKFRLELIDPGQPMGFVIDVFDSCGNVFRCDPVFLNLPTDHATRKFEFSVPQIDRYFQITNFGLTELRVALNGHKFRLISDPARLEEEFNTFLIAREGRTTIDLEPYFDREENALVLVYDGPPGATAELFLTDVVDDVDFALELQPIPTEFLLTQNYPNPFNPSTKIRFDIPSSQPQGVEVKLSIFNLLGEQVTVLVDEQKFPGQFVVEWTGHDRGGVPVSSGVYIVRMSAGEFRQTRRMLLLK